MNLSKQIAKHFKDVMHGGNWTSVNLKETLSDLDWRTATQKVEGFNTIATLVFHMNYYVHEVIKVLQGQPLTASDKYAFTHPPINSQQDWDYMMDGIWKDADLFNSLIEQFPEEKWSDDIADPKYGNYYRNIHGIIEHMHYHMGQVVILKKMLEKK